MEVHSADMLGWDLDIRSHYVLFANQIPAQELSKHRWHYDAR